MNGVLNPDNTHNPAIRDIVEGIPPEGLENFGIDFSTDNHDEDTVQVPETLVPLNEQQMTVFEEQMNGIVEQNPVEVFCHAKSVIEAMLSSH